MDELDSHIHTYIHGPFDFTSVRGRKSRDWVGIDVWKIISACCSMYSRPTKERYTIILSPCRQKHAWNLQYSTPTNQSPTIAGIYDRHAISLTKGLRLRNTLFFYLLLLSSTKRIPCLAMCGVPVQLQIAPEVGSLKWLYTIYCASGPHVKFCFLHFLQSLQHVTCCWSSWSTSQSIFGSFKEAGPPSLQTSRPKPCSDPFLGQRTLGWSSCLCITHAWI